MKTVSFKNFKKIAMLTVFLGGGVLLFSSCGLTEDKFEKKAEKGSSSDGGSGVYDWAKVKEFSDLYCVACHSEDGFESESTWLDTKKASILRTLKNGTMPMAGSSQADKMPLSEAEAVIAWLEADGAPVEEEPDTSTPSSDKPDTSTPSSDKPEKTAIIPDGVLAVVENKCIGCHTKINKYRYWYSNSFNIKSEVESGNMPKNGSLTKSQKKAILDFVKVVEAY